MTIQYIKDEEGKDQYVVIPYSDYFRMRLALLEYDDEDESEWEDIPYESDIYDDVMLPGEVCDVMHKENVSLQAAWRILRGMSQQEVAEKLGISQSAVSQLEALDSRPQKRTREKLAAIYGCTQERDQPLICRRGLTALRPALAAVARVAGVRERTLHKSSASDPGGLFACARRSYRNPARQSSFWRRSPNIFLLWRGCQT